MGKYADFMLSPMPEGKTTLNAGSTHDNREGSVRHRRDSVRHAFDSLKMSSNLRIVSLSISIFGFTRSGNQPKLPVRMTKIRMKSTSARRSAQLFFTTQTDLDPTESKSVFLQLDERLNQFNEYVIDMSENPLWTG